jgi:hypothetical protein
MYVQDFKPQYVVSRWMRGVRRKYSRAEKEAGIEMAEKN